MDAFTCRAVRWGERHLSGGELAKQVVGTLPSNVIETHKSKAY